MRFTVLLVGATTIAHAQVRTPDYQRAEQMLSWNTLRHVTGDQVNPTFYRDSTRFWYRVVTPRGAEFMTMNPATGVRGLLFDNVRLAAALARAADTAITPSKLPFQSIAFANDGRDDRRIRVRIGSRGFTCDLTGPTCTRGDTIPDGRRFLRSPDDQWEAFVSGYNIWVRRAGASDSVQLTTDGIPLHGYGAASPTPTERRLKFPVVPQAWWSPDSRRLVVTRVDERRVGKMTIYSSTTARPTTYEYPYALAGDSVISTLEYYVLDVPARTSRKLDAPVMPAIQLFSLISRPVQWAHTSDRFFFLQHTRGQKLVRIMTGDAGTGTTRTISTDSSSTYLSGVADLTMWTTNWRVLRNGEVIWFSERDGWAHFYLLTADGAVKRQLTMGDWVVTSLVDVDETLGRLYFTARGREPKIHPEYDLLYSVGLDGSAPTLLSPEPADHTITAVPTGKYFIDAWSRVDLPPVTVLRGSDGRIVRELERADISALQATGWRPGETFTVKARDGVTDITGVMWKPSQFDSTRRYPVIDHVYPGPLISPVPKEFFPNRLPFTYAQAGQVQALAELGFIVVEIDHLGNTARNKALYTQWYGNTGDAGLPDHVTAIQQLGARHRWLDLSRVGTYGHSGGGTSSTLAMLKYPDFYKAAFSTAGNHDNRTYNYAWGERAQGLLVRDTVRGTDNYASGANATMVGALKGKLFLVHGDLDDNVHPANTLAVVDALVKANKSFDLLILPDAEHELSQHPYVLRRMWDFFVEHLMGVRPPANYTIAPPPPPP